jgi:hypothetical protein
MNDKSESTGPVSTGSGSGGATRFGGVPTG